jgi:uncharacterized protein YbcI
MESAHGSDGRSPAEPLDAAIANEISKLVAELTGRPASNARAFIDPDVIVCQLEDAVTKAERKLVAAGEGELVREQRNVLTKEQLIAAVERVAGRTVHMFLSGMLGESWVEVFVLDPDGTESAGATG